MSVKGDAGPTAAIVPVQSAWASKINWTAVLTMVGALLAIWGVPFSPELQQALLTVITVGGPVAIVIFKTFFTKSVTPASLASEPLVDQSKSVASQTPAGDVAKVTE